VDRESSRSSHSSYESSSPREDNSDEDTPRNKLVEPSLSFKSREEGKKPRRKLDLEDQKSPSNKMRSKKKIPFLRLKTIKEEDIKE